MTAAAIRSAAVGSFVEQQLCGIVLWQVSSGWEPCRDAALASLEAQVQVLQHCVSDRVVCAASGVAACLYEPWHSQRQIAAVSVAAVGLGGAGYCSSHAALWFTRQNVCMCCCWLLCLGRWLRMCSCGQPVSTRQLCIGC